MSNNAEAATPPPPTLNIFRRDRDDAEPEFSFVPSVPGDNPWIIVDISTVQLSWSEDCEGTRSLSINATRPQNAGELADAALTRGFPLRIVGGTILPELTRLRSARAARDKAEAARKEAERAQREADRDARTRPLWNAWKPALGPLVLKGNMNSPDRATSRADPLDGHRRPRPGDVVAFGPIPADDPNYPVKVGVEAIVPPPEPTRENPNPPRTREIWEFPTTPAPIAATVTAVHPGGKIDLRCLATPPPLQFGAPAPEFYRHVLFSPMPKIGAWCWSPGDDVAPAASVPAEQAPRRPHRRTRPVAELVNVDQGEQPEPSPAA
jgi:hypothetical protein